MELLVVVTVLQFLGLGFLFFQVTRLVNVRSEVVALLEVLVPMAALLGRLEAKADLGAQATVRIEDAAAMVATELALSQERADLVRGPDGAAADAASRSHQESPWV